MELWGRILKVEGNVVSFAAESPEELASLSLMTQEERLQAVLRIPDGRPISEQQRKKAFAIMKDMSNAWGYVPDEVKIMMKFEFEAVYGTEFGSFRTVDMTTAREFISFLLYVAVERDVPLSYKPLDIVDDQSIERYIYVGLKFQKCAICGKKAEIHHVDKVGTEMRHLVDHRNKRLIALCPEHHHETETNGWAAFSQKYHVIGIKLDAKTLHDLHIMTYKRMEEIDRRKERDEFNN